MILITEWGMNGIKSINIPTSVSEIGIFCFVQCRNLSTINIPTSVSSLQNNCFSGCSNLRTINIPSSVISIGESAFYGCRKLKGNVRIDPNNPTFKTDGTRILRKDNGEEVCNVTE